MRCKSIGCVVSWACVAAAVSLVVPMGLFAGCRRQNKGGGRDVSKGPGPGAGTRPPTAKHLSSEGCAGCHPTQFGEWKVSLHALAQTEPVYDYYFMTASRQSHKQLETFCARCHTPVGVMTGQVPFKHVLRKPGDTRVGKVASEGVLI